MVFGFSFVKSKLLNRSRKKYNERKYKSSSRNSYFLSLFSSDEKILDILARSLYMQKKYSKSLKIYIKAENKQLLLRNHNKNKFKCALKSNNYLLAFKALSDSRSDGKVHREAISQLTKVIKKLDLSTRTDLIIEFSNIGDVPKKILSLSNEKINSISRIDLDPNSYSTLNPEILKTQRHIREAISIKQSSSYILSNHFIEVSSNPIKLLFLPFTSLYLAYQLKKEKHDETSKSLYFPDIGLLNPEIRKDCVVIFPTNGVGFGHYTRAMAIAIQLRKLNPKTEIVMFTTMPTLSTAANNGFITYHLPGRYKYDDMNPREWNLLIEEFLGIVLYLHRPKLFLFDGAYPYRGLLNAISNQDRMLNCWIRRGGEKDKSKTIPQDSISKFDSIILPGDTVPTPSDIYGPGKSVLRVNPIILIDKKSTLPKGSLRSKIGVPGEAILCYVQLGAGRINEINSEIRYTVDALLDVPGVIILIGESLLGERIEYSHPRVRILREYPNALYYEDIDFAIIAGGYNSFHEVLEHNIPSICFPNMNTGRDDQLARCVVARDAGCMILVKNRNKRSIKAAVNRIANSDIREKMSNNCSILSRPNGSVEVASWISNLL